MELISSSVEALGAGKIRPEEMPIPDKARKDNIRYAPGFGSTPLAGHMPYTVEALAKFLGEVREKDGKPHDSFKAAFGALEMMSEGSQKTSL